MNTVGCSDKSAGAVVDLAANETASVHGHRGTSIRCVRGQLWVTQEGDSHDYFLPRGVSFVAAGAGRIVVNGVMAHNCAVAGRVLLPGTITPAHQALQYDAKFFSDIEFSARRARAEAIAAILYAAICALQRAWTSVAQWLVSAHGAATRSKPA